MRQRRRRCDRQACSRSWRVRRSARRRLDLGRTPGRLAEPALPSHLVAVVSSAHWTRAYTAAARGPQRAVCPACTGAPMRVPGGRMILRFFVSCLVVSFIAGYALTRVLFSDGATRLMVNPVYA